MMKIVIAVLSFSFLTIYSFAQTTTYSETFLFNNAPTTQCGNWNNWRTTLDTCYTQISLSSSLGCNEVCTDPSIVRQIIAVLKSGGNGSWVYGSKEWYVSNSLGVFIGVFSTIGSSPTQCDSSIVVVRPCINNSSWGGCNHDDCGAPTQTITLTLSGGLVTSMSGNDLNCNGDSSGSATVTPSGGLSPYTYLWDNNTGNQTSATATGLAAGTYYVTVSDNSACATIDTVDLFEPTTLMVTKDSSGENCYNDSSGTASVIVSGGTSPYTYLWDSNTGNQTNATATGLTGGTYSVTITDDNGCTKSETVTVDSQPEITAVLSGIDLLCYGDSDGVAIINVSGGISPYYYLWDAGTGSQTNDTASGLTAGTYYITVTDSNSCIFIDSITINEPLDLTISISTNDDAGGCTGDAVATPSGGISPYSYIWDDPNTQTTQLATGLCEGYYCVTVTDSNNCTIVSCDSVKLYVGLDQLTNKSILTYSLIPVQEK